MISLRGLVPIWIFPNEIARWNIWKQGVPPLIERLFLPTTHYSLFTTHYTIRVVIPQSCSFHLD